MSSQERLRVGIIGCGAGIFHLEGYAEEPRAEVVALAGLDTDRCRQLAKQFGVPRIYGDYRELLEQDDIQAVSIVVPNHMHLPVTLAAIEAGKQMIVEKPLARTSEEGEQMVRAAEEAGLILAIAFNHRHRHDVDLVKAQVDAGALGRVYFTKAFWLRRVGIPSLGSWFTSKEHAGGGPLIDLGVHALDMALWMMGNPRVVTVSAATFAELGPKGKGGIPGGRVRFRVAENTTYEVEDFATAFLRMDDGAILQLDTSWAAYTGKTDEFGVTLFGSNGGAELHVKDYAQTETLKVFGDYGDAPLDGMPRLRPRHGHGAVIRKFVDSVLHGAPVSPSGREGLDRVRLIEAIYRSAELGREVAIED